MAAIPARAPRQPRSLTRSTCRVARAHSGHPRLEDPHPGAQLTFTDVDGHRYQVFLTDLSDDDIAYLEGIYRAGAEPSAISVTPKTPGWPTCSPPTSPSTKPG